MSRVRDDAPSFVCLGMWVGLLGGASGFLLYLFAISIMNEESPFVMVFLIVFFIILFFILMRMMQALVQLLVV